MLNLIKVFKARNILEIITPVLFQIFKFKFRYHEKRPNYKNKLNYFENYSIVEIIYANF